MEAPVITTFFSTLLRACATPRRHPGMRLQGRMSRSGRRSPAGSGIERRPGVQSMPAIESCISPPPVQVPAVTGRTCRQVPGMKNSPYFRWKKSAGLRRGDGVDPPGSPRHPAVAPSGHGIRPVAACECRTAAHARTVRCMGWHGAPPGGGRGMKNPSPIPTAPEKARFVVPKRSACRLQGASGQPAVSAMHTHPRPRNRPS